MSDPVVSLLRAETYDLLSLTENMTRHLDDLAVGEISPETRVVIKPNLIMRCAPSRTATTHPVVVEAVIRALQARGAKRITIADSPGGPYSAALLSGCYRQTGMETAAQNTGVSCNLDITSGPIHRAENELCRDFEIITPIREADLIINLCKVKTHCMMVFSCGVKNLFGCVPGLLKPQLHYRFPEKEHFASMLVDLAQTVAPAITIVDGVDGMEGDGPTAGARKHLGLTAAAGAESLYALDLLLAGMIGMDAASLPTVRESIRRGLCPSDQGRIVLRGDTALARNVTPFTPPTGLSLDFSGNLPSFLAPIARAVAPLLSTRPVIRARDCIGCGKCAETCPADTIKLENKKARIHPAGCIRCFCCHELCPVKAIDVKTPLVFTPLHRKKA